MRTTDSREDYAWVIVHRFETSSQCYRSEDLRFEQVFDRIRQLLQPTVRLRVIRIDAHGYEEDHTNSVMTNYYLSRQPKSTLKKARTHV